VVEELRVVLLVDELREELTFDVREDDEDDVLLFDGVVRVTVDRPVEL
jgi:hypothetical protein